jgi:hypothetical protein
MAWTHPSSRGVLASTVRDGASIPDEESSHANHGTWDRSGKKCVSTAWYRCAGQRDSPKETFSLQALTLCGAAGPLSPWYGSLPGHTLLGPRDTETGTPVDIVDGQREDLSDPQAGMEHQRHQAAIAVSGQVARIGAREERGDLGAGQHGGQAARTGYGTLPFVWRRPWYQK